jgi:hypothetical protein
MPHFAPLSLRVASPHAPPGLISIRIIWMPVTASGERSSFRMPFGPRSRVRRAFARTTASSCLDVGTSNSHPTRARIRLREIFSRRVEGGATPVRTPWWCAPSWARAIRPFVRYADRAAYAAGPHRMGTRRRQQAQRLRRVRLAAGIELHRQRRSPVEESRARHCLSRSDVAEQRLACRHLRRRILRQHPRLSRQGHVWYNVCLNDAGRSANILMFRRDLTTADHKKSVFQLQHLRASALFLSPSMPRACRMDPRSAAQINEQKIGGLRLCSMCSFSASGSSWKSFAREGVVRFARSHVMRSQLEQFKGPFLQPD